MSDISRKDELLDMIVQFYVNPIIDEIDYMIDILNNDDYLTNKEYPENIIKYINSIKGTLLANLDNEIASDFPKFKALKKFLPTYINEEDLEKDFQKIKNFISDNVNEFIIKQMEKYPNQALDHLYDMKERINKYCLIILEMKDLEKENEELEEAFKNDKYQPKDGENVVETTKNVLNEIESLDSDLKETLQNYQDMKEDIVDLDINQDIISFEDLDNEVSGNDNLEKDDNLTAYDRFFNFINSQKEDEKSSDEILDEIKTSVTPKPEEITSYEAFQNTMKQINDYFDKVENKPTNQSVEEVTNEVQLNNLNEAIEKEQQKLDRLSNIKINVNTKTVSTLDKFKIQYKIQHSKTLKKLHRKRELLELKIVKEQLDIKTAAHNSKITSVGENYDMIFDGFDIERESINGTIERNNKLSL